MSELSFNKSVSLKQAAAIIAANPDLTFLLQGEPGIGKSSLVNELERITGMPAGYIDVGNLDLGDAATPMPNRDLKITEYYPNGRFRLHENRPVIIMLDEFTKGSTAVKNMLHPLFEKTNRRFGDKTLPKGSIVFLTGNLSTDGVGDVLMPHTINRLVVLPVGKPDADSWVEWAMNNNIHPIVIAWVNRFPHVMASYRDAGQGDNIYIFNPKRPQAKFVSPRSLETASTLLWNADKYDSDTLLIALIGALGEGGARDLFSFKEVSDQLPLWESVLKSPETIEVPTSPGACAITVFSAITRVTKDSMPAFMTYLQRFAPVWQGVFAINIAKNPTKQAIAFSSRAFSNWVADNQDLL